MQYPEPIGHPKAAMEAYVPSEHVLSDPEATVEPEVGVFRVRLARVGPFYARKDVLILQAYATWGDGPLDHNGLPEYLRGEGWRDALPEDLATFDKTSAPALITKT